MRWCLGSRHPVIWMISSIQAEAASFCANKHDVVPVPGVSARELTDSRVETAIATRAIPTTAIHHVNPALVGAAPAAVPHRIGRPDGLKSDLEAHSGLTMDHVVCLATSPEPISSKSMLSPCAAHPPRPRPGPSPDPRILGSWSGRRIGWGSSGEPRAGRPIDHNGLAPHLQACWRAT